LGEFVIHAQALPVRLRFATVFFIAAMLGALAGAPSARAQSASHATVRELRSAADRLLETGTNSPLHRPLSISSSVNGRAVYAEIEGVIDRPFRDVARAVADSQRWCTVLILHINNRSCRVIAGPGEPRIALKVARKYDQPVEHAYELDFTYRVIEASPTFLSVELDSHAGPLGTSDYVIRLDAAPLGETRSVLRLSHAFRQGAFSGLAMDVYFATVGHGKVGFTVVGHPAGGQPEYIGGVRGLVERNLMRYFLALEVAARELDGATMPDAYLRRLHGWYQAAEAYPRQLHEVDMQTYLELKRPLGPKT
jgi:hypothetical protein